MAHTQTKIPAEVLSISWKWIVWFMMLFIISVYLVSMAIEYALRGINHLLKLIIQNKKHE